MWRGLRRCGGEYICNISIIKTDTMKKTKGLKIIIDNSLKKFQGRNLFPEKLKKANEILAQAGVPDLSKLKKK